MRTISIIGMLILACVSETAVCGATGVPKGHLVKDVPLQAFFHTAHAWRMKIYQAVGEDADIGKLPIRVCFVQSPTAGEAPTMCTPLYADVANVNAAAADPCQTLESAQLVMLPGPHHEDSRPSLVIRARSTIGGVWGPNQLRGLYVWTYAAGEFLQTFESVVDESGEQKFVGNGLLDGAFVSVHQVFNGDEQSLLSPLYYQMTVYESAPMGYVKVLSILSEKRYPSAKLGEGLPDAITTLTPEISRALRAVYPKGVSAVLH